MRSCSVAPGGRVPPGKADCHMHQQPFFGMQHPGGGAMSSTRSVVAAGVIGPALTEVTACAKAAPPSDSVAIDRTSGVAKRRIQV